MERQDHSFIRRKTSDLETLLSRSDSLEGFLEKGEGSFVDDTVMQIISIIDGKVITAVCDLAGVGRELVLVVVHLINRYIHMQQCAWKGRHRHRADCG